jgi:2-C-methyl-D-erythritol 4-phosphate cytidylyltransferase
MSVALVLAAGSGERLAAGRPKALVELAGRPLMQWSIEVLLGMDEITQVVVALPPATPAPAGAYGVVGGASRSESVKLALGTAGPGEPVLVHDAARPLLTAELARSVIAALERDANADAAIAVGRMTDTVKRVDAGGAVVATLPRDELVAVQTPQVFRRAALERALDVDAARLAAATDDAWLVEQNGGRVLTVPSGSENVKVTTRSDLRLAELLIARRAAPGDRA